MSLISGVIGSLAIVAPTLAATPVTHSPLTHAIAPDTIQQNPLPKLNLSIAANLKSAPPPAIDRRIVPDAVEPDLTQTTPQLRLAVPITATLAAVESDPSNLDDVANSEWWLQSPERLPPGDNGAEPENITVPMTVPTPRDRPSQTPTQTPTQTPSPSTVSPPTPTASNPDADNDLGRIPIRPIPLVDEDLGELPIRNLPSPPPPRPKWLFVGANIGYFGTSNTFFTRTKNADGSIQTGLSLTVLLPLGPKTYFNGAIEGNVIRFGTFSQRNYDERRLRAGILQQLSPRMYGGVGWSDQKFYAAKEGFSSVLSGDRFLNENSFHIDLSRTDPITKRLALSSFYQLRWSLSSRANDDRLSNTFFTSLSYRLSPSWTASADYLLSWSHYTQIRRDPIFQQVNLRTRYMLSRDFSANLYGGFTFGNPSEPSQKLGLNSNDRADYNGWSFGVTFAYSRGLF